MRKLLDAWLNGVSYMLCDGSISFYTFFNIILAECAYLWRFQSIKTAMIFTFVLIGYIITVLIFSWLKGNYEGTFTERVCALAYVMTFAILFIVGCFINSWMCITLTVIPLSITFLCIKIRALQNTAFIGNESKATPFLSNLFKNKTFSLLSMILITFGPFLSFLVFLGLLPNLAVILKFIILAVWLLFSPFIAFIEDAFAACDIFEIAYDITWSLEDDFNHKNNKE